MISKDGIGKENQFYDIFTTPLAKNEKSINQIIVNIIECL